MLSVQVQPCADSRATDRQTDRQPIYCGLNGKDDWLLLNVSEVNAASAAWLLSVSVSVSCQLDPLVYHSLGGWYNTDMHQGVKGMCSHE